MYNRRPRGSAVCLSTTESNGRSTDIYTKCIFLEILVHRHPNTGHLLNDHT